MKKTLLFAAVAIGMAACTNETDVFSPQEPQEISLKAVTYKPTRSAVSGTDFPKTTSMYVSAWQKDDGNPYTEYLQDIEFTYDKDKGTGGAWGAGYYYPISGSLHVQAYSCDVASDQKKPTAKLSGNPTYKRIDNLELDFSTNKLKGETDVMWSEIGSASKSITDDLALSFHHALSWIVVNFSNSNKSSVDDDDIEIKNVCLNNVRLSGKLTVTPNFVNGTDELASSNPYTTAWTTTSDLESVPFPDYTKDTPFKFGEDKASIEKNGLLVIPGTQATNTSISFQYRTKNGVDASDKATYTEWVTYTYLFGSSEWAAEKKYIYNINISPKEITIDPTVVDWGSENNTTNESL